MVKLMPDAMIDTLTDRERECLRQVAQGYSTKQIARTIGVTDTRAAKIIDSANKKLGVSRRIDAARILAQHENRGVNIIPGISTPLQPDGASMPPLPSRDEARQPLMLREERAPFGRAHDPADFGLPLRQRGGSHNDLTTWQRVIWIVLLSAIGLLGVGSLAGGLGALSDQIIVVPSPGR